MTPPKGPARAQGRLPSARTIGQVAARRTVAVSLGIAALVVAWSMGAGATLSAPRTPVISFAGKGPLGTPMPAGFLGLSLEFSAVPAYAGSRRAVDPVVVRLIRNLTPGQAPVLRVGGNSTDQTWWPVAGVARPGVVTYALTPAWLKTTRALARALGARLVLGVNLAIDRPALAAAEAHAMLAGIGGRSIAAFEIGNEPNIYRVFPTYRNAQGTVVHVRGHRYNFGAYARQFSAVRRALPLVPIAGPALGGVGWAAKLGPFIAAEPRLGLVTLHLYPLLCLAPPGSPLYPTIPHLLTDASAVGLAHEASAPAALAHAHRLPFRVDELNSSTCGGRRGVSDTFASALWALDTAFAFDQAGVDGVNIHMFPGARYALFSDASAGARGRPSASVNPEYYGLLMFAQAAPPGSRLLPISSAPGRHVKVWATIAPDKTVRVVLINESTSARSLVLRPPTGAGGPPTAETLSAPSLSATTGVSLGGRSFGSRTATGSLPGPPVTSSISPAAVGRYSLTLPAASAMLLTWIPAAVAAGARGGN